MVILIHMLIKPMKKSINHVRLFKFNVYFKYLPIFSGNHILKNWKKKKNKNFNTFYIILKIFQPVFLVCKRFFFFLFQIITNGIHWIFRKGRNLGNYLENPLILRIYKEIQGRLSHSSKLIKLNVKVAIETSFPS